MEIMRLGVTVGDSADDGVATLRAATQQPAIMAALLARLLANLT
jgi:hypothetical protein